MIRYLLIVSAVVAASIFAVSIVFLHDDEPNEVSITGSAVAALAASESQPLTFPLNYDASVTMFGPGVKEPRTRFYTAPSKR